MNYFAQDRWQPAEPFCQETPAGSLFSHVQHPARIAPDLNVRGAVVRQRGRSPELVARRPGVSPPPPVKLPSKRWRDLILRVWHVDPLRCPVCQNPLRVIAVIDDPKVTEKILRHLGVWHDPPAYAQPSAGRPPRPPPPEGSGPYTYEPCLDVDPMPDYENVLTD